MPISDKIIAFYQQLQSPKNLPAHVEILHPYKDEQAMTSTCNFYHKYYNDVKSRIILFGINPGRYGGGITGIPFTDPIHLAEHCLIPNEFEKRQELSSRFIYEMIHAYGGPENFYKQFYISAISPLGYTSEGKNLNYYDIPNWRSIFKNYVIDQINIQMRFPLSRKVAFSIGQGQNLKYLKELNKENQWFEKIIPLPHPRWVMQYRLKNKQQYINEYLEKLKGN